MASSAVLAFRAESADDWCNVAADLLSMQQCLLPHCMSCQRVHLLCRDAHAYDAPRMTKHLLLSVLKGIETPCRNAELQGVPNVILTPHIGGSTEEAQAAIGREVANALVKYVNTGSTAGAVNFPQVSCCTSDASAIHNYRPCP